MDKHLEEILNNETFDIWLFLYKNSSINLDDLWEQYTIVSIKTCNNIEVLERMDYWKFKALLNKVKKYLESENASENGDENSPNNPNNMMNNMGGSFKSMMNNQMKNQSNMFKNMGK